MLPDQDHVETELRSFINHRSPFHVHKLDILNFKLLGYIICVTNFLWWLPPTLTVSVYEKISPTLTVVKRMICQ